MSSLSQRYLCHVCKDPENGTVKPLIQCETCRRRWHHMCHKPNIDDPGRKTFNCGKCLRKRNITSTNSSLPAHSNEPKRTSGGASDLPNMPPPNKCRIQGCDSRPNLNGLCNHHAMEEKHRSATTQRPVVGVKVPPSPKPFQKKKLYPFKADEELKTLKRKRPMSSTRSGNDSEQSTVDIPSTQLPIAKASNSSRLRAIEQILESTEAPNPVTLPPRPTVEDEDAVEPPIDIASLNSMKWNPLPRPAKDGGVEHPGGNEFRGNGFRATAPDQPLASEARGDGITTRTSAAADFRAKSIPGTVSEKKTMPSQDDVEMADFPPGGLRNTQENVLETIETRSGQLEGPSIHIADIESAARTLVSRSATPDENTATENPSPEENAPLPWSLEAQRQQRAEAFDTSDLDSWLKKQSLATDDQPTPQELLKTQIWGHIDPQTAWPKEHSAEWLSEKRKEIDARGGRKANFGKLLTAQVIKERKERGWGIHQNKDVVDDENSDVSVKALRELFGIKDIDDLEPGLRNGQLVMVEKAVDQEGKKKKEPAVYVVG